MCRNGQYTERGIKQIHGFMSERWRIEPEYAMKVDPSLGLLGVLLEPDDGRGQGVGAGPGGGPARVLGAADRARDGRRSDWPARRPDRQAARAGDPRARPGRVGTEAGARARPRRDLPHRERRRHRVRAGRDHGMHGRRAGHRRCRFRRIGAGGIVCLTGVGTGGTTAGSPRPTSRLSGAEQQRRSSAASTPTNGTGTRPRSPGPRGSFLARAARHAARAAGELRAGPGAAAGRHQSRHPVRRGL